MGAQAAPVPSPAAACWTLARSTKEAAERFAAASPKISGRAWSSLTTKPSPLLPPPAPTWRADQSAVVPVRCSSRTPSYRPNVGMAGLVEGRKGRRGAPGVYRLFLGHHRGAADDAALLDLDLDVA